MIILIGSTKITIAGDHPVNVTANETTVRSAYNNKVICTLPSGSFTILPDESLSDVVDALTAKLISQTKVKRFDEGQSLKALKRALDRFNAHTLLWK